MGALRSKPYGPSALPSPAALIAAGVLILIAGVGGWVLAEKLISDPVVVPEAAPLTVRTGNAELALRAGWKQEAAVPKLPGLDGAGASVYAPTDGGSGRMVLNMLPGAATLPKETAAALRLPLGSSKRATVAGIRGVGYTALALRGVSGLVDIYAIPTAAGTLTIACVAPIDDPLPVGSCPGDIRSISAHNAVKADPAAALKAKLPAVMATLNAVRANARAALRTAPTSPKQAIPAQGLWRAYKAAAATLAAVAPAKGAASQIPGAFRDTARAYRALAVAASHHDAKAWKRASARVDAAEKTTTARVNAVR